MLGNGHEKARDSVIVEQPMQKRRQQLLCINTNQQKVHAMYQRIFVARIDCRLAQMKVAVDMAKQDVAFAQPVVFNLISRQFCEIANTTKVDDTTGNCFDAGDTKASPIFRLSFCDAVRHPN